MHTQTHAHLPTCMHRPQVSPVTLARHSPGCASSPPKRSLAPRASLISPAEPLPGWPAQGAASRVQGRRCPACALYRGGPWPQTAGLSAAVHMFIRQRCTGASETRHPQPHQPGRLTASSSAAVHVYQARTKLTGGQHARALDKHARMPVMRTAGDSQRQGQVAQKATSPWFLRTGRQVAHGLHGLQDEGTG